MTRLQSTVWLAQSILAGIALATVDSRPSDGAILSLSLVAAVTFAVHLVPAQE